MSNQQKIIATGALFLGIILVGICSYSNYQIQEKEDIQSYKIQSRQECYKIQDNQEYNNCLGYYLTKTPYREDEKLIATRLIK